MIVIPLNFKTEVFMDIVRALGISALIIGAILLIFGLSSTLSVTEQVIEGVSGRHSDDIMFYIVLGIAMIIGGAFAVFGLSKNKN